MRGLFRIPALRTDHLNTPASRHGHRARGRHHLIGVTPVHGEHGVDMEGCCDLGYDYRVSVRVKVRVGVRATVRVRARVIIRY